jgi:hypothetical protein
MYTGSPNSDDHDRGSGLDSIILSQSMANCESVPKRRLPDGTVPSPIRSRKAAVLIGYALCSGPPWA